MKLSFTPGEPLIYFARFKGSKGWRELKAVIDIGSVYCVVPVFDAMQLGYEAYFDTQSERGEGTEMITSSGIVEARELEIEEFALGNLSAFNVAALALDMPRLGRVDMVLGQSFLKNFNVMLNFKEGYMTLESLDGSG